MNTPQSDEATQNPPDPGFKCIKVKRELVTLTPFAFVDLNDHDNNVDLCYRDFGVPVMIEVDASTVVDPNGDPNEFLSFGGIQ